MSRKRRTEGTVVVMPWSVLGVEGNTKQVIEHLVNTHLSGLPHGVRGVVVYDACGRGLNVHSVEKPEKGGGLEVRTAGWGEGDLRHFAQYVKKRTERGPCAFIYPDTVTERAVKEFARQMEKLGVRVDTDYS